MTRDKVVVGLLALLAIGGALGFGLLMLNAFGRDSCLDGSYAGVACPALAEVNGVRYQVAVATELVDLAPVLSPFAPIGRTNVPDDFSELTTFAIAGIDPTAVLAAPARAVREEDVAPYRLLYGPNSARAYPALCHYIPAEKRGDDERCGAPA